MRRKYSRASSGLATGRVGSFPGGPVVFRGREGRSDKMYLLEVRHVHLGPKLREENIFFNFRGRGLCKF